MQEGLKCPSCGGALSSPMPGQQMIVCPFCGMQHAVATLLQQSDAVQIAQIRANTAQTMQQQAMQHQMQMQYQATQQQIQMQKMEGEQAELGKFKKGKLSKFLIIFAAIFMILTVVWLKDGLTLRGILAAAQTAMFIVAWLMGLRLINAKPIVRTLITLGAFFLIIPVIAVSCNDSNDFSYNYTVAVEELKWEDMKLGDHLPAPDANKAKIHSNTSERLYIEIPGQISAGFDAYVTMCTEAGYTIDKETSDNRFEAYNSEGYKLHLFLDSGGELTIELDEPMEMKIFTWPVSKNAELLPEPPSNMGHIDWDTSTSFTIYIGDVTEEEYAQYVKACQDFGYDVDYSKGDDYYYADNAYGDSLDVTYKGFNIMYLHLSVKERPEAKPTEATLPSQTEPVATESTQPVETTVAPTEKKDDGLIGAAFKEAMDEYEDFMDEYVSFMKKYSASNGSDPSLLMDYLSYMEDYAEMLEAFEKWGDEELNAAELAYYLEVQNRVLQKMAAASVS